MIFYTFPNIILLDKIEFEKGCLQMKRYISRATKWLAILTFISVAMLGMGVIFIVANIPNVGLQIGLTMFGALMSILFLTCYLADKSRTLVIDADKITFPRGADKNGKMVLQKTVIRLDEIRSIESKFHKGDGIISGDCFFHTLKLKDGTEVTVTLYAYGKESEKDILETIRKSII